LKWSKLNFAETYLARGNPYCLVLEEGGLPMHRRPSLWFFSCLVLILLSSLLLYGEANKPAVNKQPETSNIPATAASGVALKITLKASREQASAGDFFGVTATIENISNQTVFFTGNSFSLTAPPEIDPEGPSPWPAFFPGHYSPGVSPEEYDKEVIALPPKSTIPAMWNQDYRRSPSQGVKESIRDSIKDFFRGLKFPPGKYTLTVVGGYWDTEDAASEESNEGWHTQTADMQESIGAPQSTVVFGAILGGIFAFWLIWRNDRSLYRGWNKGIWVGLLSAMLLSVIVTILLARLSETEFIIRTTVNDLWGAMAVGFIGAASGPTILQRFTNALRSSRKAVPQPPKQHEQPPTTEQRKDGAVKLQLSVAGSNGHRPDGRNVQKKPSLARRRLRRHKRSGLGRGQARGGNVSLG
jgi:hypothetical protein